MPKTDDLWALSAVLETDMGERPVVVTTGTRNDVEACLDRHPELNDPPYLSYGIVRVAEGPTCEYLPEEGVSWWDEDDNEHEEPRLGGGGILLLLLLGVRLPDARGRDRVVRLRARRARLQARPALRVLSELREEGDGLMGVTWNYRGYVCPWCGRLVEEHDYESEPETEYEVECPDCGRTFWAEYQLEPVLGTVLPEVMKVCAFGPEDQRCPRFDAFDCCCRSGNGWPEPEWCPKRLMDSEVD